MARLADHALSEGKATGGREKMKLSTFIKKYESLILYTSTLTSAPKRNRGWRS